VGVVIKVCWGPCQSPLLAFLLSCDKGSSRMRFSTLSRPRRRLRPARARSRIHVRAGSTRDNVPHRPTMLVACHDLTSLFDSRSVCSPLDTIPSVRPGVVCGCLSSNKCTGSDLPDQVDVPLHPPPFDPTPARVHPERRRRYLTRKGAHCRVITHRARKLRRGPPALAPSISIMRRMTPQGRSSGSPYVAPRR